MATLVLTRLSKKPCNIYRYIQLCQRTPVPVIPVHNFAEYKFFKSNVDTFRINMPAGRVERSPEQIWKATDYVKFAVFWNQALLRHHKKTLQWKSYRATLYMGPNAELLKPIQEILGDANRLAIVLPAIPLEPEQVDFLNDNTVGVDLESFNPMAIRRCICKPSPSSNFDTQSQNSVPTTPLPTLDVSPSIELTSHAPEQTIFRFQGGSNPSLTIERPSKKPRLDNSKVQERKEGGVDAPDVRLLVVRGRQNARGKADAIIAVVHQMSMKLVIKTTFQGPIPQCGLENHRAHLYEPQKCLGQDTGPS
ncbi:hypothetical protein C8J57DRAFT_1247515 [Mycena rebaudengoi]|nr:hypothetical protein C8J57DRAFT_1247515 [Mycena rebaudengoi]